MVLTSKRNIKLIMHIIEIQKCVVQVFDLYGIYQFNLMKTVTVDVM